MRRLLVLLLLALCATGALAQGRGRGFERGMRVPPQPQYSLDRQQREQLREDLNAAQNLPREQRPGRGAEPLRMSPEERERLRRDIQDANRDMDRGRRRR